MGASQRVEFDLQLSCRTMVDAVPIDKRQTHLQHFLATIPNSQPIAKTSHPTELLVHPFGGDVVTRLRMTMAQMILLAISYNEALYCPTEFWRKDHNCCAPSL